MAFSFKILAREPHSSARAGMLGINGKGVLTPLFMPVGTQGAVKGLLPEQLKTLGVEILLANAYHLYLRPGINVIKEAGGLHRFMNWERPILTDSGGFQVFSLSSLRKISEEGVTFRSHLDGSLHEFTPEKVIEIQSILGSDIVMPLDECVSYPVEENMAREALLRSCRWYERSLKVPMKNHQTLFAIIQGSVFRELRKEGASKLLAFNPPGFAIGGLSVGEPKELAWSMLEILNPVLPEEKPRYFMGLGTPEDLLEAVERGVDMFDCVFPTRAARHGLVFTRQGRLMIRNAPFREDFSPLDEACECYACKHYTRAYLHHLLHAREMLAPILLSYHNVAFLVKFMRDVQEAIRVGGFVSFKKSFLEKSAS